MVTALVGLSTGPLWMGHFHVVGRQNELQTLMTNPNARPDAYTNEMARTDRADDQAAAEKYTNIAIELAVAKLEKKLPPLEWRARIRDLEAFKQQHEGVLRHQKRRQKRGAQGAPQDPMNDDH